MSLKRDSLHMRTTCALEHCGDQCNALGQLSEKMLKMDLLDVAMSQQNAQRNEERLAAGTS